MQYDYHLRGDMLSFDDRRSDASFVDVIWRSHSVGGGTFLSVSSTRLELVVAKHPGGIDLCFHGPETLPTEASYPAHVEWFGITFKQGVFLPRLPVEPLIDGQIVLPKASNHKFWLDGATWQLPDFDNADGFVAKLVQAGVLARDPLIAAALSHHPLAVSASTLQRRFLRATGMTFGALSQIERARKAARLLHADMQILDVVDHLGYSDQPHLTRSLKRFIGRTPAQMRATCGGLPLPFLNEFGD